MEINATIAKIRAARLDLEAKGVIHLAIFGSRSRGNARPESDLDVLLDVVPDAKFSLFDLAGVELLVTDVTGFETNVFMKRSLQPDFIKAIQKDLRPVF